MDKNKLLEKKKKLRDGLLAGFDDSGLEKMVYFGLDIDLDTIVSSTGNLTDVVFELIKKAEDEGWVDDLIKVAYEKCQENDDLAELNKLYVQEESVAIMAQLVQQEKHPPLTTGSMIDGRYKLEDKLGSGRIGVVYKAKDTYLGRKVAIKLVQQAETLLFSEKSTFIQEAVVVARLTHPHLIEIFDYDNDDPQIMYIVMEYMEGGTLANKLSSRGALPLHEVKDIVDKIAPALIEAHDQGVEHLDIRPSNILFDGNNFPYLSDFRLPQSPEDRIKGSQDVDALGYMAPEQLDGKSGNIRTDVYQLGLTIYEMLTGKQFLPASTPEQAGQIQVYKNPPRLKKTNQRVPNEWDDAVAKALAIKPSHRYADVRDFMNALGLEVSD